MISEAESISILEKVPEDLVDEKLVSYLLSATTSKLIHSINIRNINRFYS